MQAFVPFVVWQLIWQCVHMQLAIDNVLPPYLGNQFGYSIVKAANFAAIFGLMNFWARPLGGYLSDLCGRRYGRLCVRI